MTFVQRHAYGFGCGLASLLWPLFRRRRRISVENILRGGVADDDATALLFFSICMLSCGFALRWSLGATTDETPRTIDQPLTFLRPGIRYIATVYGDAPDAHWDTNPTAYEIVSSTVTCEDTLTLRLAPGGGAAVSFLPE